MAFRFSDLTNPNSALINRTTANVVDRLTSTVSPLSTIRAKAESLSAAVNQTTTLLGNLDDIAQSLGSSAEGLTGIDNLVRSLSGNNINPWPGSDSPSATICVEPLLPGSTRSLSDVFGEDPCPQLNSPSYYSWGTAYRNEEGLVNELSEYASHNYIFTLAALTPEEINDPVSTYRSVGPQNVIARSGGGAGSKKVRTAYENDGDLEYFIDDLQMESLITSTARTGSTTAVSVTFKVTEPYSMGVFLQSVQLAAVKSRFPNYLEAPYLLMIEFVGWDDDGNSVQLPTLTRYIPLMFINMEFNVEGAGSVYNIEAAPYNEIALSDEIQTVKTETTITGRSVAEILNNGRDGLTTIINRRLEEQKRNGEIAQNDYYIITFPKNLQETSRVVRERITGILKRDQALLELRRSQTSGDVTTTPALFAEAVANDIGLSGASNNSIAAALENLALTDINEIGESLILSNPHEAGDHPFGAARYTYQIQNPESGAPTGVFRRNGEEGIEITLSRTNRTFKFSAGQKIQKIIDEVVLTSDYGKKLATPDVDSLGMVNWYKINVEVYSVPNYTQTAQTGTSPKVYVYSVVPYKVSADRLALPTQATPNLQNRRSAVNKVYDYIYTGKNDDIIDFDIQFKTAFYSSVLADRGQTDASSRAAANEAAVATDRPNFGTAQPSTPSAETSEAQRSLRETVTNFMNTNGGAGFQSVQTAVARQYNDALVNSKADMIITNLTIWGDPYFLADSGVGNYNARDGMNINITTDGTVSYQRSEVDVIVGFRTPVDYRPDGPFMEFPEETIPVKSFSGLYQVVTILSKFNNGTFTQELELVRRNNQELRDAAEAGGGSIGGIVQNAINAYRDRGQPRQGIREGEVGNTAEVSRFLSGTEQSYLIRVLDNPLSVLSDDQLQNYLSGNISDDIRQALAEGSALVSSSVDQLQNLASEGISEALDLIGNVGDEIGDLVVSGLGNIGDTLGINLGTSSFDFGNIATEFGGALQDINGAISSGVNLFADLTSGGSIGGGQASRRFAPGSLLAQADNLAPPGVNGFNPNISSIGEFANKFSNDLEGFASSLSGDISGAIDSAVGFAGNLLGVENASVGDLGLDAIGGAASDLIKDAGNLLSSVGDSIGGPIPFGFDTVSGAFDAAANLASKIELALPDINTGINEPLVNSLVANHAAALGGLQGDLITNALGDLTALSTQAGNLVSNAAGALNLSTSISGLPSSMTASLSGLESSLSSAVNSLNDPLAPPYTGDDPIIRARLGLA